MGPTVIRLTARALLPAHWSLIGPRLDSAAMTVPRLAPRGHTVAACARRPPAAQGGLLLRGRDRGCARHHDAAYLGTEPLNPAAESIQPG